MFLFSFFLPLRKLGGDLGQVQNAGHQGMHNEVGPGFRVSSVQTLIYSSVNIELTIYIS